jgi:diguanylate cyclase (GGDEF)-like protein
MLLRLKERHDVSLLAGLAVASFCIFSDSVASTLTYVRGIEAAYGLQLVPGLVVLATAFSIHQAHKHRLAKVESREQARRNEGAQAVAAHNEALVAFGHALAAALGKTSRDSVHDVIARGMPGLLPGREVWVLTRDADLGWTSIVAVGDSAPADRERAARLAVGETDASSASESAYACFPLVVGSAAFGAVGVGTTPALTDHQHRVLGTAASLMAAALKNADLVRQTRLAGMRDQLTGFFNRAHTLELLEAEMRRARRSGLPLSIVMVDLDGLKAVNDRRGHLCGDALITAATGAIQSALRGSDVKGRYGGDEFLLLLPETPIEGAEQVAEGLRRSIDAQQVWWNGERIGATASLGVTAWTREDQAPDAIVARADAALYRAKAQGRNAVVSSRQGALSAHETLSKSTIAS